MIRSLKYGVASDRFTACFYFALIFFISSSTLGLPTNVTSSATLSSINRCTVLLGSVGRLYEAVDFRSANKDRSSIYLNLVRHLAMVKNVLDAHSLEEMAKQPTPPNPLHYRSRTLSSEDMFSFESAFNKILNDKIDLADWLSLRDKIKNLSGNTHNNEVIRKTTAEKTASIFHPVVLDEFRFQSSEGNLQYSFDLPDGGVIAVVRDGEAVEFVDISNRKITYIMPWTDFHSNFTAFRSRNGSVFLSIGKIHEKKNIYEITTGHEIKTIFENFERIEYNRDNSLVELSVIENSSGRPAILQKIKPISSATGYVKIGGFLEVELPGGLQKYTEALETENRKVTVEGGQVITYELEGSELTIRNITISKLLRRMNLPPLFISNFKSSWFSPSLNFQAANEDHPIMFFGYGFKASNDGSYLDLVNENIYHFEIDTPYQQTVLIRKRGENFKIIKESTHDCKYIAVFDEDTGKLTTQDLSLPVSFGGTPPQIFKLDGSPVLITSFNGQHTHHKFVYIYPLNGGASLKLDAKLTNAGPARRIWQNTEGHILGIYESNTGFKIVQIYGPLPGKRP